ncbi:4787_t:CDS:2 [Entrophospora sp. SA101]|nr:13562_t:CDS:2 [Entrophospora sp. SA101]CAJ0913456.1 4784_t:CDS:2 [Entrophospora sp. SA101]CAJ0913462.1 4787_t:CDS:2 [Entrophospora sp. SA101]
MGKSNQVKLLMALTNASVNLLVNTNGNVLRSEVLDAIKMRCHLSDILELRLGQNDKVIFENTKRSSIKRKDY